MAMKSSLVLFLVVACGPKGTETPKNDQPPPPMKDTRTEFEQRFDRACSELAPVLSGCAVSDADAKLAAGEITKAQHADVTKPEIRHALERDWMKFCYQPAKYSSRQLRVLEVCKREESECEPIATCLENFTPVK